MEELLRFLLEKMCDQKDVVQIQQEEDDGFITFIVDIADEDKGRIIGKGGQNIKAIRTLLSILGKKQNKRVMVKVS